MLADLLGVTVTMATGPRTAQSLYADPVSKEFAMEVPADRLTRTDRFLVRGSKALVRIDVEGDAEEEWSFAERVLEADKAEWISEKREGAGRDPRLLPLPAAVGEWPIFREANAALDQTATSQIHGSIFDGNSAADEVCENIVSSGLDPSAYGAQFLTNTRASPKMSGSNELQYHLYGLWLMACVDRVDGRRNAMAEHICRRVLQQQAAIRKDPKAPSYESLGPYMEHASDSSGIMKVPKFIKHVAEQNRDDANVLKQQRFAKEESEASRKKTLAGKKKKDEEE